MIFSFIESFNVLGGDRHNRLHRCDIALPLGGQSGEAGEALRGDLFRDRSLREDDDVIVGKDAIPQGLSN